MSDWVDEAMRRQADEIDRLREDLAECQRQRGVWIELARDAEAEAEELRAELVASHSCHEYEALETDYRNAAAAIARVRELCEGWPSWREVTAAEVLRTLDGAE